LFSRKKERAVQAQLSRQGLDPHLIIIITTMTAVGERPSVAIVVFTTIMIAAPPPDPRQESRPIHRCNLVPIVIVDSQCRRHVNVWDRHLTQKGEADGARWNENMIQEGKGLTLL
jgi:hypothetical protein